MVLRGDGDVRFDAVVGRNVLTRCSDKPALFRAAANQLLAGGVLSLAEVIPRRGQRLSALAGSELQADELWGRWCAAEELIYQDLTDPMVNWDANDLERMCHEAGLVVDRAEVVPDTEERRVTPLQVSRWFSLNGPEERPSYAQHLLRQLTPEELAHVQELCARILSDQVVPWQTHTLFLVGRHR
jgi:putative ATPase